MDFMKEAIALARSAASEGEAPVGAVIVRDNKIIGRGMNRREAHGDIAAHAEIEAMRMAAREQGDWRLSACTLYVTLEPCAMCAAAAVQAQLECVVFGAFDEKAGACGSRLDLTDGRIGRTMAVAGGIYAEECAQLLKGFFAQRRAGQHYA